MVFGHQWNVRARSDLSAVARAGSRAARAVGLASALALGIGLLPPVTGVAAAQHRVAATAGRGPVATHLPVTSRPHHGLRPGQEPPILPPRLKAGGQPQASARKTTAPHDGGSGGGGGGTGPQATNLYLLPGLVTGDTSQELYFDAPDSGWTQGEVTLFTANAPTVPLHSTDFNFAQAVTCSSPARFCFTLDNADGWDLTAGTSYEVTVGLVAPDGTKQVSAPSPAVAPRVLPNPAPVAPEQLRGQPGTGSEGPTDSQPVLRGVGVNTATGAFTQHAVDAELKSSYAIDVAAERTYSSEDTTAGLLGTGWSFSYEARVFARPGTSGQEVFRAEDGSETTYTLQAGGTYLPPAGALSQLAAVPGAGWMVTTPAQQRLNFDARGRLQSFTDERGKGVTLGYDASGNLATVTDAGGRVLHVTVQAGLISQLQLPDGRTVNYAYSGGRLHTVRDPDGEVTTYDYDGSGRLQKITDALGHTQLTNAYDSQTGRVSSQIDEQGHVTSFSWDQAKQESKVTDPDGAVFTDGYQGNVLQYSRNGNGDTMVNRTDARGNQQVLADPLNHQYEQGHDGNGNVTQRQVFGANPATEPANVGATEHSSYDSQSNLTQFADARGGTSNYAYNQFNQVTSITDAVGNTTRLDYDTNTGLLTTVTDALGNKTTYAYDSAGEKVSQTDPLGHVTSFTYDGSGRETSTADPRGGKSTASYDGEDRAVRSVDPLGHTQQWSYDNAGRLHTHTDGNTFATTYTYNDADQLTTITDPDLRTTQYAYTAAGRLASETNGAGGVTKYGYDSAGRLAMMISPLGSVPGADPTQFTTTYTYDFNGNRTSVSHPYPGGGTATTQYAYDSLNHVVSVTDPLGQVTSTGYDAAGNQVSVTDPLHHTTTHGYDADNRPTTVTDPNGNVTTTTYDAAGRVSQQKTALGQTTTHTYDAAGHLIAQTSPLGNATTYAYDASGNQTSVTDPLGNATTTAYDADNQPSQRTDANGRTTTYTYDADNRVATIQGPDATSVLQVTTNTYDHDGHLITQVNPLGYSTRYTYDGAGRLSSSTDQLGRVRKYGYDADGNVTSIETARGTSSGDPAVQAANTITQQYDILGRLIQRQLGSGGVNYALGYDADNEITSLADSNGQQSRAYDAASRLTSVTRGGSGFTYTYDAAGNLSGRTLPDGSTQALTYDADNRPITLTGTAGGATYSYDADSNVVKSQLPGGSAQQRTYDSADRLARLSDLGTGGQVLSSYALTRDGVGNPTRVDTTQLGQSHSDAYTYDAANRLAAMCQGATSCSGATQVLSFTYDLVGNRLTRSLTGNGAYQQQYSYDAANELSYTFGGPQGTVTYNYDFDGNQVQAGNTTSSYDLANQLTAYGDGSNTTIYAVDAAGNRLSASTTPVAGGSTSTIGYQWDVNNPLPMLADEQTGSSVRSYTYNPDGSPLSLGTGGSSFLYQPDPFGNTAELTDLGGGVQQQFTMTDPFGGFAQTTPGGPGAPAVGLGFQGQYQDPHSQRYDLRARDYVTDSGRFQSVDPVMPSAGVSAQSPYVYANDNPLTGSDPSGRFSCGFFQGVCNLGSSLASGVTSFVGGAVNAAVNSGLGQAVIHFAQGVLSNLTNLTTSLSSFAQRLGGAIQAIGGLGRGLIHWYSKAQEQNDQLTKPLKSNPCLSTNPLLQWLKASDFCNPQKGWMSHCPVRLPGGVLAVALCPSTGRGIDNPGTRSLGQALTGCEDDPAQCLSNSKAETGEGEGVTGADSAAIGLARTPDGRPGPAAEKIADKAWRAHRGDWADAQDAGDVAEKIQDIMDRPNSKQLADGRVAWWDGQSKRIVIYDPGNPEGGTAFRPTTGKAYFDNLVGSR